MWVVKLGGSLSRSDNLRNWLQVLAAAEALVIVPGGGPFADQVRHVQDQWGFDDSSAHTMALLAMEQFGTMLCGLQTGLVAAATIPEMRDALDRSLTPVWMPTWMVMAESMIPHSWEVTSDSLSAWLSGRLEADGLLLVKSVSFEGDSLEAERLAEGEIVDARFCQYQQQSGVPAWLVAECDYARFDELRRGNMASASRLLVAPAT